MCVAKWLPWKEKWKQEENSEKNKTKLKKNIYYLQKRKKNLTREEALLSLIHPKYNVPTSDSIQE